jgi:hypothetical protein
MPLWWGLIFGGCISVALQLGMVDPRERVVVHGLMLAGAASVVTACLLIVYFLDHPYQRHTGGIQQRDAPYAGPDAKPRSGPAPRVHDEWAARVRLTV